MVFAKFCNMFSSEKKVVDLKDKQIRQAKSPKNVSANKCHSKVQSSIKLKIKLSACKRKKNKITKSAYV